MEEIKINDYVRTIYGKIDKVTEIIKGKHHTAYKGKEIVKGLNETIGTETDIVKHSKNIKELVEAGDFINGMQVDEFDGEEETALGIPVYEDGEFNTLNFYVPIESINIRTILTKEKFESECFKVEGGQDV